MARTFRQWPLAALAVAACAGRSLDVGSTGTSSAAGPVSVACDGATLTGTFSDGSGYAAWIPRVCSQLSNVPVPLTSVAQASALVVGLWVGCELPAVGTEYTSDGHYATWAEDTTSYELVPSGQVSTYNEDGAASPDGTYDVVDASATLGPGTFQLRTRTLAGVVNLAQLLVTDSPRALHLGGSVFVAPDTMKFRANVCDYREFGPRQTFTSEGDVAAYLKGRWAWCSGAPPGGSAVMGLEFPGDGTWYNLYADYNGHFSRGNGQFDFGAMTVRKATALDGPEPYTIVETFHDGAESTLTQPVGAQCQRALTFTWANMGGLGMQDWTTYQPIP